MSLTVDGFWKAGFWSTTFWADGFWTERRRGGFGPAEEERPVPLETPDPVPELVQAVQVTAPPEAPPENQAPAYDETRALDAVAALRAPATSIPALREYPLEGLLEAFTEQQQVADEEAALLLLITIH